MQRASVLVIEDSDDQRLLLASLLEDSGFEVRACADAVEGLALLSQFRPSAILLDWYLPRLGGEAFVRCVRADPRLAALPVVVLTGALRLNTEGVDAVLLKPADVGELLSVLRRLISRRALSASQPSGALPLGGG